MKSLRNKVMLIGNLGNDPETKTTASGKKRVTMSIATSESYRNQQGERVTDTQWHRLVVWGKLADLAESYLNKGSEIAVEGRLVHRSYEDQAGARRFITEVNVNDIVMLNTRSKNGQQQQQSGAA